MEPGTPVPMLKIDGLDYPLSWSRRSEALISSKGHSVLSLTQTMRKRRDGFYALCVAVWAALPPMHPFSAPEELAEFLADEANQLPAYNGLAALWRHFYPKPAEKKSASKP